MTSVSIITPSYNQQSYLEAAIQSVLQQDYQDIEYIIADGGSTDGSAEILAKYASHLAWWISEPDKGQAEAINKGLQHASGEIVGWLNSDDVYLPGTISKVVETFRSYPDIGLVYGDAFSIDETGRIFNLMRAAQYNLLDLLSFKIICQPAVFMRRTILDRAGILDETYHMLLDHQLWIRMATLAPIKYLPVPLAEARFHQAAKNRSAANQFSLEAIRLLEWVESQPQFRDNLLHSHRKIRAGAYRLSGFYLTDAHDPSAALISYGRSLIQYPPIALHDWRHVLLAVFSLFGLQKVRSIYDIIRRDRFGKKVTKLDDLDDSLDK